jgi:hypothetical protein
MTPRYPALLLTIGLLASGQAALAQSGPAARPVSDAELKSFAGIVVEVRRIADTYHPRLEAAQTVREQQKIELAASDEMGRAVTQEGMTVERYQEILKETLRDPDLSAKVRRHIKASQK